MKKRWMVVGLLLAPLGFWIWIANDRPQAIFEYQVPTAFTGWITIRYGVPGAPPLPFDAGTYTFRIPASGILETSSPRFNGRHTARYFRADRGGAVLIAWDPPPLFHREGGTERCASIFVPVRA